MAEIDDLVMQIERLETDNRRLKNQLKFANKEIDKKYENIQ